MTAHYVTFIYFLKYASGDMAHRSTIKGQHNTHIDECKESPAHSVCNTFSKHLECKTQHENKESSEEHEDSEKTDDKCGVRKHLYCPQHKTKTLRSFCEQCDKTVCTKCITESHNDHVVKKLSKICKEIRRDSQRKHEEIEEHFLPKYTKLLETENKRKAVFSEEAEEIKNEMKAYTENVVKLVKQMGKNAVIDLKVKRKEGLQGIDSSKAEIQTKIDRLHQMKAMLSKRIEAGPNILFLKPVSPNLLDEFQRLSVPAKYRLSNFQPGEIDDKKIKNNFGNLPILEIDSG